VSSIQPIPAIDSTVLPHTPISSEERPAAPVPPPSGDVELTFTYDLVQAERAGTLSERVWHRLRKRALEGLLRRSGVIPGRDTLLDIGCNSGPLLLHLGRLGYRIEGVDLNPELVRKGREYLRAAGLEPSSLKLGNASRLEYADGSLDCVLMIDLLEHCVEEEALVAEAQRVLRSGGRAIVAVPCPWHPIWHPWLKKILSGRSAADIDSHPDRFKTGRDLARLFAGFRRLRGGLRVGGAWIVGVFEKR
jgi:SAM-dependent methyltransferase